MRLVHRVPANHTAIEKIPCLGKTICQAECQYPVISANSLSIRLDVLVLQPQSDRLAINGAFGRKHVGSEKHGKTMPRGEAMQVGVPDH
jgi:hypothetical protein